ncbi:hypothetical protein [Burkholderia phage FLC9]|nr:hypothetical protein [Burkholderia phage FLC9]
MFDHLIKGARAAFDLVFTKKTPNAAPASKPEAASEQPKALDADKPFHKPKFPVTAIVILAAIIVATLYVEMHLAAILAGLTLIIILASYVTIQKVVDAANLAVPDPGDDPGPWPWPTSDSMGAV